MGNKNRYIVTGAAGFIGYSLVKRLLSSENSILAIDNISPYYSQDLKRDRIASLEEHSKLLNLKSENYHFHELDIRNFNAIDKIISEFKPHYICHLAAQAGVRYSIDNPLDSIDNNITPTLNLLESAKNNGVKDFIFASSSSVYGKNLEMPFTEKLNPTTPISVYASSKAACEAICHSYNHNYQIRFRILRFFTVYGPWGRPDMSYFLFTKSILNGKSIDVFNNGDMFRDFTYIDDIVDGILLAVHNPLDFEIINLGFGEPVKLGDFISTLEEILGVQAEKNYLPIQPGDVHKTWSDITKAQKILKYYPKINIKDGLSNFVDWYKEYY
tara:strand:- start:862 stop:1845 length:984 start_codon:yes stop_codon:yes gene_type:complete